MKVVLRKLGDSRIGKFTIVDGIEDMIVVNSLSDLWEDLKLKIISDLKGAKNEHRRVLSENKGRSRRKSK